MVVLIPSNCTNKFKFSQSNFSNEEVTPIENGNTNEIENAGEIEEISQIGEEEEIIEENIPRK